MFRGVLALMPPPLFSHVGQYEYVGSLQHLDGCRPRTSVDLPQSCREIVTPLKWKQWSQLLAGHPDQQFVQYVVQGIQQGFRVGFNYDQAKCQSASRNMPSTDSHAHIVANYLDQEVKAHRVCGPLNPFEWPQVQVSRFGVIPKSTPGKWRLILDLSSPDGFSVNDGIDGSQCSLSYVSIDDAVKLIRTYGKGALMAKVDIKSAYRAIPVHPDDRALLGMVWKGQLFIDKALPFGLRSAPIIFTAVADAAEWVIRQEVQSTVIHYLDDFLVVAPPQSSVCAESLQSVLQVFEMLGLPVAEDKLEGQY